MWVWNILLTGKKNNLFLKAENTQEDIADKLHIPQTTVSDKIRSFNENGNIAEIVKKLNLPSLYYTKRETAYTISISQIKAHTILIIPRDIVYI